MFSFLFPIKMQKKEREEKNLLPSILIEKDEKDHYLVLGCGNDCLRGNHKSSSWDSIDPAEDQKPTFLGTMEDVIESKKIPYKYSFIFAEAISGSIDNYRLNLINSVSTNNAVIIVSPGLGISLPSMQGFITAGATTIIFKEISPAIFENTKQVIRKELLDLSSKEKVIKIINKVDSLLSQNELLRDRSLWLFLLAHIQLYVEDRQQRKFRNYFKDELYQEFQHQLESTILNHLIAIDSEKLFKNIQAWQQRLPSSTTPQHKLRYDLLSRLLERCENAIRSSTTQVVKNNSSYSI
jgi:hypothetical protein